MLEITRISANGQYLSTTYCAKEAVGFEDPLLTYLGHADRFSQYHDFTAGTPVDMPERVSAYHTFDYNTKQWVDRRTLQDFKGTKWADVKQSRSAAEFGTFTYNNMVFDGDLDAQRRLASYVSVSKSALSVGQPFSAEFILANNTVVTLTAQDFVGIELAKVQAVAVAFAHATNLRAQIESATTIEEVEAIVW